jgi:hypothetical protein
MVRSLGSNVHMRCADGCREGTRSVRRFVYRKQLDLDTKAGKIAQAKVADPAILRKLERRPVNGDKLSDTAGPGSRLRG